MAELTLYMVVIDGSKPMSIRRSSMILAAREGMRRLKLEEARQIDASTIQEFPSTSKRRHVTYTFSTCRVDANKCLIANEFHTKATWE